MAKAVKVTLRVSRSGPAGSHGVGDQIDVTPTEAARMFAAGQIEPLTGPAQKAINTAARAERRDADQAPGAGA